MVDITTLNNRQYCVLLDPVGKDGKPQLGQKRLVKVSTQPVSVQQVNSSFLVVVSKSDLSLENSKKRTTV